MTIDNKFDLEQKVYLTTDPEQLVRVITAIHVRPGYLLYELTAGTTASDHYDFEISPDEDTLLKMKR